MRKHAPELLHASREALRHLFRQDPCELDEDEVERQRVMAVLREAIEAADPTDFDESEVTVRLTMTHLSWLALRELLEDAAKKNDDDRLVLDACLEGHRETKQRVYVVLPINPLVLRRLKYLLEHKAPSAQAKAFGRMAKQIEEDGLSQNPMEVIARMAL